MNIVFQYAVKVVVGESKGRVAAQGQYWTAINVHNPFYQPVKLRKKLAIGLPNCKAGPISEFRSAKLDADEALEIDREDIFKFAEKAGYSERFIKGFIVIQSYTKLDVVAVYTAAGKNGFVETFHTERVRPRRLEIGMPDLIPVPDTNGFFCRRENGNLIVTVRNQGNATAGPSTTRVDFGRHGIVDMPTPGLIAGASTELKFPIPPGCFDPDCQFRIFVDVHNVVAESDESNNMASGTCLG